MATPFDLQIVTPERLVFSGKVTSATMPACDGYLGLLAHHAPLVTALGKGKLTVQTEQGTREWQVNGGLLEVHANIASVLADEVTG